MYIKYSSAIFYKLKNYLQLINNKNIKKIKQKKNLIMGNTNLLSYKPTKEIQSKIAFFKKNNISDIIFCKKLLEEEYPTNSILNLNEFTDIFSSLHPNIQEFFPFIAELNSNKIPVVDIYECLSIFALFTQSSFQEKMEFIFCIFDFDDSKLVELPELVLTINSVLKGLCKFNKIPSPKLSVLEKLAEGIFGIIDKDHSQTIEHHEFLKWVKSNSKFQDFLLIYSGTQVLENALRRFNESNEFFEHKFNKISLNNSREVNIEDLKASFKEDFKDYDNDESN